jgi:hypothetical protein
MAQAMFARREWTGAGMADRMSSVEIEDVLSSIRRLVAQDLRPRPVVTDDKLILTPALRVVPSDAAADRSMDGAMDTAIPADDGDSADVSAASSPPPLFVHRHVAPRELAEAVSSIGAAVPDDGYESETGEMGPADALPVPDWPESSWTAPEVISAVDEAEVVDLAEGTADGTASWAQDADLDLLGEDLADDMDAAPYTDVSNDPDVDGDAAEAAALASLADDDMAGRPGVIELDEEMLRNIVREVIREELQGALGERITRNVRKLVRSEINRAMVTRDLD